MCRELEGFEARPDLGDLEATDGERGAMGVSIVIDRLPKQGDLSHTFCGKLTAFFDDVVGRAMDFRPSGVGDHAVGAEFVAPSRDPHIGTSASEFRLWIRIECT